jgi:hypothetical protein
MKWNKGSSYITCWEVAELFRTDKRFAQSAREGAISAFLSTNDFKKEVPHAVSRLLRFRPFSAAQLRRIIEGSSRNQGIYGCWAARTPMETLIKDAKVRSAGVLFGNTVTQWNLGVNGSVGYVHLA